MRGRLLVVIAALVLVASACSGNGNDPVKGAGTTDRGGPVRLVVLGDQHAFGEPARDSLHTAWSQVLFTKHLPSRTIYVDLALDHATVADVRAAQVPQVAALKPTLIVVWTGLGDEERDTPDATFRADLTGLLDDLEPTGAKVVVVAGGRYTTAIQQVADDAGVAVADVRTIDVDGGSEQAQQQVAAAVSKAAGPIS